MTSRSLKAAEAAGSEQALNQATEWVKFADTKATILTAALGVITTMTVANVPAIVTAMARGTTQTLFVGFAVCVCVGAFAFTLGQLLSAIYPRRHQARGINRYSWPTLARADVDLVLDHMRQTPAHLDALSQTLVLAAVAEAKFAAVRRAVGGFALLLVSAVTAVVLAVVFNTPA
ncbi:hypothetical protein [Microbacterium sp. GXF0217]